jgi:L-alanine-DL-glutamate epimerase-like enolase superfamily enzyme
VANANRAWDARQGFILQVTDAQGVRGRGEASPLPGYSPDALSAVSRALDAVCKALPGTRLGEASRAAVARAVASLPVDLTGLPSARCALEVALLDLVARREEIALEGLLGATSPSPLPLCALLGLAGRDDLLARARSALAQGITTLKVKLGADLTTALPALQDLRAQHPQATLRLDANGTFPALEVAHRLRSLAVLEPEFVEEPCGPEGLLALGTLEVPWAVDESLQDPRVVAALQQGTLGARAVVLKPMLHGYLRALDLGLAAREKGYDVVVTHLFDGPVAMAGACALALALGRGRAQGLAAHPFLARHPADKVPHLATGGWVSPAGVSGHGVGS